MSYVYKITRKDTKEFYFGVKYSKKADPNLFWINYFTSSNTIHKIISFFGKDIFIPEILFIFNTKEEAQIKEKELIILEWKNPLLLNGHSGGVIGDSNKGRKIINPETGMSSYSKAGKKVKETKIKNNIYKIAGEKLSKTLKENPDLLKKRIENCKITMEKIGEDGLNGYQRRALKMKGENNPSSKIENREKISKSLKNWYNKLNEEEKENIRRGHKEGALKKREDGLNQYERHSLYMKEKEFFKNTIWVNNGKESLRVNKNEVPYGYKKGRLKFKPLKERTCPYCGKIGKGSGMTRYHFNNCKYKEEI